MLQDPPGQHLGHELFNLRSNAKNVKDGIISLCYKILFFCVYGKMGRKYGVVASQRLDKHVLLQILLGGARC